MSQGKRIPISIETKLEVLDALQYKSKIDVAREFGIGYSTVKKIKQNEKEILKKVSKGNNLLRKRNRQSPNEEVGEALITWYHQMKTQNIQVNGPIMKNKATELAKTLGYDDFRPSHGWLERLKARNNIRFQKSNGRQSGGSSGNVEADDWVKNILPRILEGYDANDVFNAVESALFYKAAPSLLTGNNMPSAVTATDRLTIFYLCNSTGTDKHVFVIGKISNPSCFDTEGTPLPYYSSSNALMTDFIWRDILQKMDQNLDNRKIILFVNNAACHNVKLKLKNIKTVLLPTDPNLIQPLDRGIIRMVKIHYRSQLLKKMISVSNKGVLVSDFAKTINLLQALRMLDSASRLISQTTIVDCFQKAGFYTDDVYCLDELPDISKETSELKELLQDEFESYIECDKDINCYENSTNSKSASVESDNQEPIAVDEFSVTDNSLPRVSYTEALEALSVVRRYLDENFTDYNAYYEVEEMVRLSAYAGGSAENEMD